MDKNKKFKRIEKRLKLSTWTGRILTVVSFDENVRKSKKLSTAVLIGGCVCSATTFVTYVQSLEQYGVSKDVNEWEILIDFLKNGVAAPIIDTTLLINSLKDIINNP